MASRFWPPSASAVAAVSVGSTLNASAMQLEAISIDSESSEGTVPSVMEVERKSIMASARCFLEVTVAFVRMSVTA